MISIEILRQVAKLKGIKNIGHAEKDYLIDIVLLSISRNTKDELVFKGGTCLYKFYKLDRFSEDIDFTLKREMDASSIIKKAIFDLSSFGVEARLKEHKAVFNSILATINAKGPLYQGSQLSLASIAIDINAKSSIDMEPVLAKYASLYPDIPSFSIFIMQKEEILAEKIRAIMMRKKARDAYDLWFLLKSGTKLDIDLVKKKLEYGKLEWKPNDFDKRIRDMARMWNVELAPLVSDVPNFLEVRKYLRNEITKAGKR